LFFSCCVDVQEPEVEGGIDTKLTGAALVDKLLVWAISGPTYEQQPAFSWDAWPAVNHDGQPTVFEFDWVLIDGGSPI
jgi:hypothetical protein